MEGKSAFVANPQIGFVKAIPPFTRSPWKRRQMSEASVLRMRNVALFHHYITAARQSA